MPLYTTPNEDRRGVTHIYTTDWYDSPLYKIARDTVSPRHLYDSYETGVSGLYENEDSRFTVPTDTTFPNNITDPIERTIVEQLGITKAEYDANGISSVAEVYLTAENATFDGSNNLTAWTDSSGNSEPVTISPTPPFRGTSLNGIDGVANNGNSNIELTLDSYPLTNTSTFELFVVARPSVRVQTDLIAGIFASDVNNGLLVTETFQISDDDSSGVDAEDTTWSIRQDAVKGQVGKVYTNGALFGVRRNGTTMAGDLNGVNQISYTAPAATCAFQRISLLINRGSNRGFSGSVFNCLLLNTSITDTQRQAINLAIGEKFGLPIEGVAWFDAITDPVEKSIVQAFSIHKDEYDANGVSNYIAAWYDATQGVTGFPSVTSWLDRSNDILATSIGPDLPVVATNEDTNTTAIRWESSGTEWLEAAQNIVPGTSNRTVFTLIKRQGTSGTGRIFVDGNIDSFDDGELYILSVEPAIRVGNGDRQFDTPVPDPFRPELFTAIFEGTSSSGISFRIDAEDVASTSTTNKAINTAGNLFEIGQDSFAGDILDLIISPHALMQYQVDLIEGGLATKHGLPFGGGSWFNSLTASQQTWVTNNNITEYEFDEADALYGDAFSAWSLRWVNPKQYTGPVGRVRRSSDDAELDFDANDVQSGALLTFVGANDGHLVKLYDQTGNGNDLETNDTTQQPMIISAGANVVQAGRLAFDADTFGTGSVKGFQVLNTNPGGAKEGLYNFLHDGTTIASSSSVLTTTSNGFSMVYQSGTSPGIGYILNGGNDDRINIHGAGEVFDANTSDGNLSYHSFVQLDPGNVNVPDRVDFWKAGVDQNFNENVSTGTASLANHNISFSVFRPATGQVYGQELVVWNIDKAAQRTQIEADVNKYYTL